MKLIDTIQNYRLERRNKKNLAFCQKALQNLNQRAAAMRGK